MVTLGFTALFTWVTIANWTGPHAAARGARVARGSVSIHPRAPDLGLGQLTICVLGVLVITTEYSTGVIRSSLLAVPKRLPMLAAKIAVFAALLIVLAEIVVFRLVLHRLGDPAQPGAGVAERLPACCARSSAPGCTWPCSACSRWPSARWSGTPPGAISTAIGVVFVLPILAGLLPAAGARTSTATCRNRRERSSARPIPHPARCCRAWEGFGVFCIWAALLLAAAAYLLQRRDA